MVVETKYAKSNTYCMCNTDSWRGEHQLHNLPVSNEHQLAEHCQLVSSFDCQKSAANIICKHCKHYHLSRAGILAVCRTINNEGALTQVLTAGKSNGRAIAGTV